MSAIVNGKGTVGIRGGAVVGPPIITQFITTWRTDNPGTSTSTQISIPTTGSGYACTVDWGDGTSNSYSGTAPVMLHTYSSIGTYTVKISGTFPRIYFFNGGDRRKLLTIENWGNISWTSMANAFYGCTNLKINASDLPNFTSLTSTQAMFNSCSSISAITGINAWDMSKVTTTQAMFPGCNALTSLDLSNWNLSACNTMLSMFETCNNLTSVNTTGWILNTTSTLDLTSMFGNSPKLSAVTGINNWNTSKVITTQAMFQYCSLLKDLNLSNWNMSSNTTMASMFIGCTTLTGVTGTQNWNTYKVNSLLNLFRGCNSLQTLDLSNWNLSACTTMQFMCYQAANLKSINTTGWNLNTTTTLSFNATFNSCTTLSAITGINAWNTSKVITTQAMFPGCNALTSLDLSNWNLSACNTMLSMFETCNNLRSVNTTGWILNTTTPLDLGNMFYNSPNLSAVTGINNWNTSKVTSINAIVQATKLPSLDLSGWNMSACTSMVGAFASNSSLTAVTGINSWNTSKVVTTQAMFQSCTVLKDLDVTGWNMSANTSMINMFATCSVLSGITGIENWNLRSAGVTLTGVFQNAGLSTAKYTGIIVGWANYVNTNGGSPSSVNMLTQTGRVFQNSQPGGAGFANAGAARTYLTGTLPTGRGWTIGDTIIA